jgi:flagellar biogenesis protein FliO
MFWDDENDNKGWQIFKNMPFLRMPVDNETRDEMMPIFGGILFAIIIIGGIIYGLSKLV